VLVTPIIVVWDIGSIEYVNAVLGGITVFLGSAELTPSYQYPGYVPVGYPVSSIGPFVDPPAAAIVSMSSTFTKVPPPEPLLLPLPELLLCPLLLPPLLLLLPEPGVPLPELLPLPEPLLLPPPLPLDDEEFPPLVFAGVLEHAAAHARAVPERIESATGISFLDMSVHLSASLALEAANHSQKKPRRRPKRHTSLPARA
jgi:hypothetical protein